MMLEHGFDGLAQVGPAYRNLTESSPMPFYMITIVKASSQLLTRENHAEDNAKKSMVLSQLLPFQTGKMRKMPRWRRGYANACRALPLRFESGPWLWRT